MKTNFSILFADKVLRRLEWIKPWLEKLLSHEAVDVARAKILRANACNSGHCAPSA
jgi:hypothetical protein